MLKMLKSTLNYVSFSSLTASSTPSYEVNCALRLSLIAFKTPIYQDWSDSMPIDSVDKDNSCFTGDMLSGDDPLQSNGECNSLHMPETITKDWIFNNPKYKHLFQRIG